MFIYLQFISCLFVFSYGAIFVPLDTNDGWYIDGTFMSYSDANSRTYSTVLLDQVCHTSADYLTWTIEMINAEDPRIYFGVFDERCIPYLSADTDVYPGSTTSWCTHQSGFSWYPYNRYGNAYWYNSLVGYKSWSMGSWQYQNAMHTFTFVYNFTTGHITTYRDNVNYGDPETYIDFQTRSPDGIRVALSIHYYVNYVDSLTLTNYECYTASPTTSPSKTPTVNPTSITSNPSQTPSKNPTASPTPQPTNPSKNPTKTPTKYPTNRPSENPTKHPTETPSKYPTKTPSKYPTNYPTEISLEPTNSPSKYPSQRPTNSPVNNSDGSSNNNSSIEGLLIGVIVLLSISIAMGFAFAIYKIIKNNKRKYAKTMSNGDLYQKILIDKETNEGIQMT